MNKNNCDFFKEQIMLKFYGEPYENSILTHIENCPGCKKFEKELTEKFEFNSPENKFDSIKKEITLNQNVFFKFFNSNFIKYSAAVIIILFLPVILVVNSGKKNIENYSVNKKTDIQLTNVTVNHQGGETKINYTEFSDMESEINQLKSDMDNFMSNIITEVSYNEEI